MIQNASYSINKYLPSTIYMPEIIAVAGDKVVNKTRSVLALTELTKGGII